MFVIYTAIEEMSYSLLLVRSTGAIETQSSFITVLTSCSKLKRGQCHIGSFYKGSTKFAPQAKKTLKKVFFSWRKTVKLNKQRVLTTDSSRGLKAVISRVHANYSRNDIALGVLYRSVINRRDERHFIHLFKEERPNKT